MKTRDKYNNEVEIIIFNLPYQGKDNYYGVMSVNDRELKTVGLTLSWLLSEITRLYERIILE